MNLLTSLMAGTASTLLLAVSLVAANGPATKPNQNTATIERKAWPAETLAGKIMMVDPNQNLVVVETPDGVPFDILITPRTRINSTGQRVTLNNLSQDVNQNVSVKFVPEGRGDIARSIQING
jgi:hypothetical protein